MFYRKSDAPKLRELLDRHERERVEAIEADVTGEGYIYQMFAHELANHEYGYTYDLEETLDAVGLTAEQIKGNKALHPRAPKGSQAVRGQDLRR